MVDGKHQPGSMTDGGGDPSIMSGWLNQLQVNLEQHGARLKQTMSDFQQGAHRQSAYATYYQTGDQSLLDYTTRHQHVSLEEIAEKTQEAWDKITETLQTVYRERIPPYSESLLEGATRTQEHLAELTKLARSTKTEAQEEFFKLNNPNKYVIDGKPEVKNVQPMWDGFHTLFDFHDKVLLPYIDLLTRILTRIDFTKPLDQLETFDVSRLNPKVWYRGAAQVKDDDRFATDMIVYRGHLIYGNRAIYASSLMVGTTEKIEGWRQMIRVLKSPTLRFLPVPNMKDAKEHDGLFDISPVSDIAKRVSQLAAVAQNIIDRKGDTNKLVVALQRLDQAAKRLWSKASQVRETTPLPTVNGEPREDPQEDAIAKGPSKILYDVTQLLRVVVRLITEYFDTISVYLMMLGGLTYATKRELNAYVKPNKTQRGTDDVR